MLKISIHEDEQAIEFTLSGRLAGPWVGELDRAWSETAPRIGNRTVQLDLRDLTYSDAAGKRILRVIYAQTKAVLIAGTLGSQQLAKEIKETSNATKGVAHGIA
jgi:hypothetical protein